MNLWKTVYQQVSEFTPTTPAKLQEIYLNSPEFMRREMSMMTYFYVFIDAKFPLQVVVDWFQNYIVENVFAIESETIVIDPGDWTDSRC